MGRDRTRWPAFARTRRGQTTQDFAIGVGIFLLAVAVAFSAIPSLVGTDAGSSDRADRTHAERVAAAVVDDLETGERPNELDGDRLESEYADTDADLDSEFAERFGLRAADGAPLESVTITLETIDREAEVLTSGDGPRDDGSTSDVERIVSVDGVDDCQPACRLVVEVWR